jgi:integrase/recombinase XerD
MAQIPVEVLSSADVDRLLAAPDRDDIFGLRDAAILSTLYYAAANAVDVAHLDVADYKPRRKTLRLESEEGKPRRVGVKPPLVGVLDRYLAEARTLLLAHGSVAAFPTSAGGKRVVEELPALFLTNKGHRIQVQDIRQILGAHSKNVAITKPVNYNTLRLSRAWHLREAGESPESIQRLLGASGRSGRRVI